MPLTPKRQRFVHEYLIDPNATRAAIKAGYSPRTAKQQGSWLLTNVDVSAALSAERERVTNGMVKSASFVYDGLVKEAENVDSAPRDRIRALELVGKLRGEFIQRTETHVTHELVQTLTDEQLEALEDAYTRITQVPIEGKARLLDEGAG